MIINYFSNSPLIYKFLGINNNEKPYFCFMNKTILTAALMLLGGFSLTAETIDASDSRVSYIGRTLADDGKVSFDWSATTLRLRFTGSSLKMKCSDTHADYLNLWVDRAQAPQADGVIKICSDTTIVLFKGKKGPHEVILQKRTEGEQGTVTIESFTTDGKFLAPPAPKQRLIEFVGDSYTCGFGTESASKDCPFRPEEENPALTYADILGRYFDAEAIHISHSGRGIVRNYDDYNQPLNMVNKYSQTFDENTEITWTPDYTPDVVVIYLGTNDFSCGKQPALDRWCHHYARLLGKIRANYGESVPIVCMASPCDEQMDLYVEEAVKRSGIRNISFCSVLPGAMNQEGDLGAAWHPNYKGQRKVASILAPYIATATGWELPFKAYE